MANPFQAFAFAKGAAGPPAKNNLQQPSSAAGNTSLPDQALRQTAASLEQTPKRRTRAQLSPPPKQIPPVHSSIDSGSQQQQQQGGDLGLEAAAVTRSRTRGSNSSSSSVAHAAATRKRKAYASLTGPPKGLGPKLGTAPLRLILVGHNPSEHAFHTGHFYSNPSNRMWPILIKTGIAPPGTTGPEADDTMPAAVGIGFVDVGSGQPGTDSSLFTSEDFQRWRGSFYERLRQHVKAASDSVGCKCGYCGAPALIAFTGKRQFLELCNIDPAGQLRRGKSKVLSSAVQLGKQPPDVLPPGWALPTDRTEVWVLTSTSGAAPMSNADRERPYQQLAERLAQVPWPRDDIPCQ